MGDVIGSFANILYWVLTLVILARVILSWLPVAGSNNPLIAIVYQLTEPILAPIRAVVPRIGIFDLTPMIALFILWAIRELIFSVL